jgi:NAD(P)-dependent dehydrogenase (short-subunit alcohol dehydrogenase family)
VPRFCCSSQQGWHLASLSQQQTATISDRHLRHFGKTKQKPRQRDFQPGMILRDIEMTRRCLPVAGFVWFGNVSYGATKAWMKAFGDGVCIDLHAAGSKVTMQTLSPGYTHTEFQQAMGLDPTKVAPPKSWSTASDVVSASLAGLKRGKHLVVPGWRNRALIRLFALLPWWLRQSLLARKAREGRGGAAFPGS